ncbi:MAG: HEAT repeat domain-containing protein [Chloroflexi bacterium]|nr:HEAT repeat domain-containing protein [Chloroflexota bacterium]
MVDRQLISQLQSINASQRREAIIALGRTKDREAIPHLSRVVEIDPDETLRELARKAAIYIDKHAPVVNVKPFKMPWDDLEEDEEELESSADAGHSSIVDDPVLASYTPPSQEDITAQQDLEWAERYIERAWQAHYTNDRAGAESNLRKAFREVGSHRRESGRARGRRQDHEHEPGSGCGGAAQTAHTAPARLDEQKKPGTSSKGGAAVRKTVVAAAVLEGRTGKTVDEIEDGSAGRALLDLFIYFVIAFVIGFAVIYLLAQFLNDRYDLNSPVVANDPSVQALRPILEAASGEQGWSASQGTRLPRQVATSWDS